MEFILILNKENLNMLIRINKRNFMIKIFHINKNIIEKEANKN